MFLTFDTIRSTNARGVHLLGIQLTVAVNIINLCHGESYRSQFDNVHCVLISIFYSDLHKNLFFYQLDMVSKDKKSEKIRWIRSLKT